MKIGLAIYKILVSAADVTALVSTRIYPNVAKQTSAFPFIVYQTTGVDPNDTKDGVSTVDGNSFMVLCYSYFIIIPSWLHIFLSFPFSFSKKHHLISILYKSSIKSRFSFCSICTFNSWA